jgi:hypothetical protein
MHRGGRDEAPVAVRISITPPAVDVKADARAAERAPATQSADELLDAIVEARVRTIQDAFNNAYVERFKDRLSPEALAGIDSPTIVIGRCVRRSAAAPPHPCRLVPPTCSISTS